MKCSLAGPNEMCKKAEPRTAEEVGSQPAEGGGRGGKGLESERG